MGDNKETKSRIGTENENNRVPMKSLIVLYSYHHLNTEKIAKVFAGVLDADIKLPKDFNHEEIGNYDIIGFGSGIYSSKHHESLIELADELPQVNNKKVFIFSTGGMTGKSKAAKDHSILRQKLQAKGYIILNEFQCKGFNTNRLKLFGGINKGRPNTDDLKHAEDFAKNLVFCCSKNS